MPNLWTYVQFQEWVLCRIKYGGKRSKQEETKIPEVLERSIENTEETDINSIALAEDRADSLQHMQLVADEEHPKMSESEHQEILLQLEEMLMSDNEPQLAEDILLDIILPPDEVRAWVVEFSFLVSLKSEFDYH